MTTQTQAPTLADLEAAKAAADAEAAAVAAQIAEARQRADEADAAIRKIHRDRIEAWARSVIAGDGRARREATAAITTARQAFTEAVAAGSPEFLRKWLDVVAAQAVLRELNTKLQQARYELGIRGEELPDLGRNGQVGEFLDEIRHPLAQAVANIVSDAEDRAFREHQAVLAGETEDGNG